MKIIAVKNARVIARTIIKVCLREPRNRKTAIAAKPEPINPEELTLARKLRINIDSSKVDVRVTSAGITPDTLSFYQRFFTPSTTFTVLASRCF
jgi:hypothetical protein